MCSYSSEQDNQKKCYSRRVKKSWL